MNFFKKLKLSVLCTVVSIQAIFVVLDEKKVLVTQNSCGLLVALLSHSHLKWPSLNLYLVSGLHRMAAHLV